MRHRRERTQRLIQEQMAEILQGSATTPSSSSSSKPEGRSGKEAKESKGKKHKKDKDESDRDRSSRRKARQPSKANAKNGRSSPPHLSVGLTTLWLSFRVIFLFRFLRVHKIRITLPTDESPQQQIPRCSFVISTISLRVRINSNHDGGLTSLCFHACWNHPCNSSFPQTTGTCRHHPRHPRATIRMLRHFRPAAGKSPTPRPRSLPPRGR